MEEATMYWPMSYGTKKCEEVMGEEGFKYLQENAGIKMPLLMLLTANTVKKMFSTCKLVEAKKELLVKENGTKSALDN